MFICPICFTRFSEEAIYENKIDIGHVWPKLMRVNSIIAKHQQILLCKCCNSKAGTKADAAMQKAEEFVQAYQMGEVYQKRRITVSPPQNVQGNKITVDTIISLSASNEILFYLEQQYLKKRKKLYNDAYAKMKNYSEAGIPHIEIQKRDKPPFQLAAIGWLTSAYLLSFYMFGYRYILQDILNPVRKIILDSFQGNISDIPTFEYESNFAVAIWEDRFYIHPTIGLFQPYDQDKFAHIQINYQYVHVRLPIKFSPPNNWHDQPTISDLPGNLYVCKLNSRVHEESENWQDIFALPDKAG